MVVKIDKKTGMQIHSPPYTKAEEDEFYRRVGAARLLSIVQLMSVKSRRSPENSSSLTIG